MNASEWLTSLLFAVGFGSIPSGLLIARYVAGLDIREVGSGNIGATNIYRALGLKWGAAVFGADAIKGIIPVLLARALLPPQWIVVPAVAAVTAHIFNPWLKFRGGKGVATAFGAMLAVSPLPALVALATWGLVLWRKKIVSLASLAGAAVMPGAVIIINHNHIHRLAWFAGALVISGLVVFAHRENIGRLRRGEEEPTRRLDRTGE